MLPKVNHRLRSFNGLRPWMVDFLCEGGAWGRSATCGMWHEASDMQSAAGGRRHGGGVTFCIKPQFRAPDSCPD